MLAQLVGQSEEHAGELLDACVGITVNPEDVVAGVLAQEVHQLLTRTLTAVLVNAPSLENAVSVEVVIGSAEPRHDAKRVHVSIDGRRVTVSAARHRHRPESVAPVVLLLASCYVCAAAVKSLLGEMLPFQTPETLVVDIDRLLGADVSLIDQEIDFGEAFLAGAGAIGNGFVLGLSKLSLRGTLHVVDDDVVSDGNLQRCILFSDADVDQPKADVLKRAAESLMPQVEFVPHTVRLQDVPQKKAGAWLRRLVVAVDSPRARRELQAEIPREVFDASTTGAEEIVLHSHLQPTAGACLACVYRHSPQEDARERHIAESLGVTVADVRELRVSPRCARAICNRYSYLRPQDIEDAAYDTLFKALCSTSRLITPEGRQVLAPFAFVSVLAGAMLALEFVRRVARGHAGLYNEWRLSPWNNPVARRRQSLERAPDCEFCGNPILRRLANEIWG